MSRKNVKQKERQNLRLKELSMKKEWSSKELNAKRGSKNIDLSRRESRLKEKLSLRPIELRERKDLSKKDSKPK